MAKCDNINNKIFILYILIECVSVLTLNYELSIVFRHKGLKKYTENYNIILKY